MDIVSINRRILSYTNFSFQNLYSLFDKTKPIDLDRACNLKLPVGDMFTSDMINDLWDKYLVRKSHFYVGGPKL